MFGANYRWWIAGGVIALVVSSLGITTTLSYLKTAWRGVGQKIRDATPIAFDLARLNEAIRSLEPEIRNNQEVAAKLEVEVEYREKEVAKLREEQIAAKEQMRKLRDALRRDETEYVFAGRTYTRPEIEQDLKRRLDEYEQRQAQLTAVEQIVEQQRRTLNAVLDKVRSYQDQYHQLVAKAEQLQAELKLAEAAQAAGDVKFDTSKLAQAKQLATEVEKRIRVLQRVVDNQRKVEEVIPVEVDDRSAAERFDELFGPDDKATANAGSP